jgi:sigma-B regulation protein RsbU (phosphoserine phosphatase)
MMHQLPCGVISFTDDGTITSINNTLLELLQYQQEDLENKKVATIFSLATCIFYQTHLFPLIKLEGKVEEIYLSLKDRQGNEIPVLLYGHRIAAAGQELNHCVVVPVRQRQIYEEEILNAKRQAEQAAAENVELLQIKEELELKTKLADQQIVRLTQINNDYAAFSKVISHDLQEPIRKISVFSNIIQLSIEKTTEKTERYFGKINKAVYRLIQLTKSLGRYVALNSNGETAQELSLNEIIDQSREEAIQALEFDDFDMETGSLPSIHGYPQQIKQLFYELIRNSIQYRDQQRKLRISVTGVIAQYNQFRAHEDRYQYIDFAKIQVSDNATGFGNEYSQYVFELFNRLHTESEGIGFGLALCKKIVDNHYGTITCTSNKGTGTVFTILLPVHRNTQGG